jgi:hypothetical protein
VGDKGPFSCLAPEEKHKHREVSTLSLEQPHLQVSKTVQSKARGQRLSHGRASSRRVELGFDGGFSGTVMRLPIMNRNFRTLLA